VQKGWPRWRAAWRRKLAAALAVTTVLAGFGWLWWLGVLELYRAADGTVDNTAVSATRTGLLALGIGVGAVGTMWINSRNLHVTTQTFKLTQQGQLHDRFTKANEQLGDESIAVRLGGIYALKQLAEDTERPSDQEAVVEVLSAFVRMNFDISLEEEDERRGEYDPVLTKRTAPPADVLAAISVLAQLPKRGGIMRADFTGVVFDAADLTGARLRGGNLSGVDLRRVGLMGADLSGAIFRGADLRYGTLESANLAGAQLEDVKLRKNYLVGVNFEGAFLQGANFAWVIADRINLRKADLTYADFYEAVLGSGDLRGAIINGTDFTAVSLKDADLRGVDLRKAKNLTQGQVDSARGDRFTRLPGDLTMPPFWLQQPKSS
jgi:hypothetical protein